jgi:L-fucose isomerase-like protein
MERRLNLITLYSSLNDQESLDLDNRESMKFIRSVFDTKIINPEDISKSIQENDFTVVFVASGGCEEIFMKISDLLPKPVIILSDSYRNSLAASIEISSWLNNMSIMHKHINIPAEPSRRYIEEILEEIDNYEKIQKGLKTISNLRIGLIGGESAWLISSKIDKKSIEKLYGVQFIDISTEDVIEQFKLEKADDADSWQLIEELVKNREVATAAEAVIDAVKMYNSLNHICIRENLDAFTIKCFDILSPCNTTACLALSLMNDNGIVAGCEGDIPSLWSMILARELCLSTSFMANPSSIERVDNSIDFAHCTAPLSLGKSYKLTTHYESKKGIGVASKVNLGKFTLFKCGGEHLDKFSLFEGEVVQNTSIVERCRTQIKFIFKSEEDLDSYLKSHLGNHSILIPGKHKRTLKRFITLIGK